ncbi:hypothetical protein DVH24_013633 [Malus domestica]|uniref:Uncharacterized protein n=1 Tax=Malus domestica TaxID=3750 RepID=A0A498JE05_MALDO|nr:hypothetical protein DVH24_013633 [Malus domestica]
MERLLPSLEPETYRSWAKALAHEKARRTAGRDTSRSVFQRLGGDFQPRALSEVFRNHEASEEAEDKEAKGPTEREIGHP